MGGDDFDKESPGSGEARIRLIMEQYHPVLTGYLRGKVDQHADREDIIQETFVSAYYALDTLADARKLGPWLIGIARNKVKDWYRRKRAQEAGRAASGSEAMEATPDTAADPRQRAYTNAITDAVAEAIGELNEKYRLILFLRLVHELSNQEVAQRLDLREGTVRVRFMRGVKLLRKALVQRQVVSFPARELDEK